MSRSLRSVPTEALQRELKERSRCLDCKTEWSRGWYPVAENRSVCFHCRAKRRLVESQRRRSTTAVVELEALS